MVSEYSGIILNQRTAPEHTDDLLSGATYQDFFLPSDYVRGVDDEVQIPALTGVQIFANATSKSISLTVSLQRYDLLLGWVAVTSATITEAPFVGAQWLSVFFPDLVDVPAAWTTSRFRIFVQPTGAMIYYSVPNPLNNAAAPTRTNRAYVDGNPNLELGASAVLDLSREVSLRFRVLANVADSGIDALGNGYRAVAVRQKPADVSTVDTNADALWVSGPQPSRFAVVSLYFDVRRYDLPTVIDRILLDPVTPNVYFHVYYSNDVVDPTAFSPDDWDNLLWSHVPATFRATRRETHALPAPVSANFIKIEFSHLQAKPFAAGDFQKPILYRKHPKWVLDYFLYRSTIGASSDDHFIADGVSVSYDALSFAYEYYLDDLRQEPDAPAQLSAEVNAVKDYLTTLTDASDVVDRTTLGQINSVLNQWTSAPALRGKTDYLPTQYAIASGPDDQVNTASYPVEGPGADLVTRNTSVSSLDREPILQEQGYPVMFFFLTCRHKYREVSAPLSHDRAYFVGVREIQFDRDLYSSVSDGALYADTMTDGLNAERNDMVQPDFTTTLQRT